MDSFGSRLRSIRLSKSMSLRDLCEKTSVHYAIISQYENNLVFPQVKNLVTLSTALKVNLHWLITGKGPQELPGMERKVDIKGCKAQLAAAQKELQELRDQFNALQNKHYEDNQYIIQLQKDLLKAKK